MLGVPLAISGTEVRRVCDRDIVCPWCLRTGTAQKPGWATWSNWIHIPYLSIGVPYVCEGCALIVYAACASRRYDLTGDRALVHRIAQDQGINEATFRLACLRHQIATIKAYRQCSAEQQAWLDRVKAMANEIAKDIGLGVDGC